MTVLLLVIIFLINIYFFIFWGRDLAKNKNDMGPGNIFINAFIGFITNFFDTLGIGSFAPSIMLLNLFRQNPDDKKLPGTLNVGDTIPVLVEAVIFITAVKVQPLTLFSLLIAAGVGAGVGGKLVPKMPEKIIQVFIGFALIVTALLMVSSVTGLTSAFGHGTANGLVGWKLILAIVLHFVYGALMTVGIGLYAPSMVTIYLLGLNPLIAFPVMMGACTVLMPVASAEFARSGAYNRKIAVMLAIFGVIGVIIAAKIVKSLPITILEWLVVCVAIYTGIYYLVKALRKPKEKIQA